MQPPAPPPLPGRPATWWDRNGKWLVVVAIVVTLAGSVAFVALLQGILKGSSPYQIALTRAQESPAVVAELGTPVESGWFVAGEDQTPIVSSRLNLAGRIKGPKGSATLTVTGTQSSERSQLKIVVLVDKTGAKIDLSDPPLAK